MMYLATAFFSWYVVGCALGSAIPLEQPRDCQDLQESGYNRTGIYTIFPVGTSGFQVRCDMETGGGGWTVIQRRISDTDFYKGWSEYETGFGNLDGNFWLGNRQINAITRTAWYMLRVNLLHPTTMEARHAEYEFIFVQGPEVNYALHISGYSGNVGDSMKFSSGAPFSTYDNDSSGTNRCPSTYHGAWWYKSCLLSNLNGDYDNTTYDTGLVWTTWTGHYVSMKETELMVKRFVPSY